MAFAGGALGGILADKYEDYLIQNGKEVDQKTTPLLIAGLAAAVHYMGKGKMDDLACGMLGAAGSDLGTQLMNEYASGDGAANGMPNQLSPQQMNGLRERVMEMRKRMRANRGGDAPAAIKSGGTGTGVKLGQRSSGTFYVNPYNNTRVA